MRMGHLRARTNTICFLNGSDDVVLQIAMTIIVLTTRVTIMRQMLMMTVRTMAMMPRLMTMLVVTKT